MRQRVDEIHVKNTRNSRVEHDKPVISSFLVLGGKPFDIKVAQSVVRGMVRLRHPGVVGGWVRANLRRLTWSGGTGVRDRSIDLRGRRSSRSSRGRPANATALTRTGAGGTGRGLRREATGSRALRVLRLERRRLRGWRRRRRWALQPRRGLRNLVRRGLLLLGGRRWWDRATWTSLAGDDGAEGIRAHANSWGRSLRRAGVRRGANHGALRGAPSSLLQLTTKVTNLFFKPVRYKW